MTDDMMNLRSLVEKSADADLQREMIGFTAEKLIALEVATGAGYVDLSRFDAALLIAFTATKETNHGTQTDGRNPQGCGADRADQWANA